MSKLINCKACGKQVSETAGACPHCGEPTRNRRMLIVILVIGAALWLSSDVWVALLAPLVEPFVKNLP